MASPAEFDKPASAGVPADEPVIHVIPEKFYGAALKKKITPEKPAAPVPAVPSVPPPPVPGAPVPPAPPKKGKKGIVIAIIAVLLLVAGGGAAYFFFFRKPATTPPVNVVTGPRCGDNTCDTGESSANCSADCKVAAVCGDSKCDATETLASCAIDCTPAVACGDNKCDASETVTACPADCKPPEPVPGLDTDSDGLSDDEEREVFGTDPSVVNTDRDSFVDLNEALNLFDPAAPSPAMLKDNPRIAVYSNTARGYAIFRPAAWTVRDGTDEVTLAAPAGETVTIRVETKTAGQSLADWFKAQNPETVGGAAEPTKTRQGYDAMMGADRRTTYVDLGDRVVVLRYDLDGQTTIRYNVTFQMMMQSLRKL